MTYFKREQRNINQDHTEDVLIFDPRQVKLGYCLGFVTDVCCQGLSMCKTGVKNKICLTHGLPKKLPP